MKQNRASRAAESDTIPARRPSPVFERRFFPFFVTQFLGALNDNLFKNALIIMIAFQGQEMTPYPPDVLINLSAGLFILPFFLFSATAGQWIERQEKSRAIRLIKLAEILIMLVAMFAFIEGQWFALILLLFLMGAQSAFFGPAKYSYIPQQLDECELVEGNAWVQGGTFVAILAGTMLGGILIAFDDGKYYVSAAIVGFAGAGYLASRFIPPTPAGDASLSVNTNIFMATLDSLRNLAARPDVRMAIIGISWFWFLGATYLTQLPNYTRTILGGDESVVTLLLALFTVGIGCGALLCEKLSAGKIDVRSSFAGAAGLTLFGVELFFAAPESMHGDLVDISAFLSLVNARLMLDVFFLGSSGGMYIVPLLAFIQQQTERHRLARTIAGNNIVNAFFMVLSALFAMVFLGWLGTIAELFLVVSIINVAVISALYMSAMSLS